MNRFPLFRQKMLGESLPEVVVDTFCYYYEKLVEGSSGFILEKDILPISRDDLEHYDKLSSYKEKGCSLLPRTAVIKLNGGLGTSMGLNKSKSLLEVKAGKSFLDIVAQQMEKLAKVSGGQSPTLIFMNSFSTDHDTREVLALYPDLPTECFLQHKFPKILQQDLSPALCPENPQLEWNPPGHGDIYCALVTSGLLDKLLSQNIHYAFISNIDNLAATMSERILGYFAEKSFPFMMEVTQRTEMDKKGGHLARKTEGGLLLRESAQCLEEEKEAFGDIERYCYFNTNSIWVDLAQLSTVLQERSSILGLPMIRNSKRLNPRDNKSPEVYQLETAMGAAISCFPQAAALEVPRTRFAPVKKCNELLLLWSDFFELSKEGKIHPNPARRRGDIVIKLDDRYYSKIDQLEERFPQGAPSFLECDSFTVEGDVIFSCPVKMKGTVKIINSSRETKEFLEKEVCDTVINI